MSSREDHEQGLSLFVEPTHRVRFRESLSNERLRRRLRQQLAHFGWLDERFVEWVALADHDAITVELRERGAPDMCVVISEDVALDGRELALDEALHIIAGDDFGALVSCLPGRLGLYYEEPPNHQIAILQRPDP